MLVEIFTDGSCLKNPGGPGGWGVLLRYGEHEKELSGYEHRTTNNRMELMAAICGLEALKKPSNVILMSDSQYVINGVTKWIHGWIKMGWRRKRKPIPNADLWIRLKSVADIHKVHWVWVRGHSGHKENTRVDILAGKAARQCAAMNNIKLNPRVEAMPLDMSPAWAASLSRPHNIKPVIMTQRELDIGKPLIVKTTLRNKLYSLPSTRRKRRG